MTDTAKPAKPLRQAMPLVTAFIDDLRAAFGAAEIDAQIRAGLQGLPVFYATEAGHQAGTQPAPDRVAFTGRELVLQIEPESLKAKK